MNERSTEEITRLLNSVNWDFQEYVSSSYPEDINSLHWYPAAFVPQIPSILIQLFSTSGDTVLDPFAGSGVTLVEAAKQGRTFLGVDWNPYAIEISKAKFQAINCEDWEWLATFIERVRDKNIFEEPKLYCERVGISDEIFEWFHLDTIKELLAIHSCVVEEPDFSLLKKVVFSSVLKSCCSQKKHYTYVTDRCFPSELVYSNAKEKYINQLILAKRASDKFRQHYSTLNSKEWRSLPNIDEIIRVGDARNLNWIGNSEVNLVVTSPPYLGCNDYLKSMRLTYLFFPSFEIYDLTKEEIGARCKRHNKLLEEEYIRDLTLALKEFKRVIQKNGHLAIVFGQGKGRVRKTDLIHLISELIVGKLHFVEVFNAERSILFHRVRFPGVRKERIMVFQKSDNNV
jgi:DNA modification methylase